MSKSKIHETWDMLSQQMERLLTCNRTEMDNELKRSKGLSDMANAQASFAESEARVFLSAGFLPETNFITTKDDAKLLRNSNYADGRQIKNTRKKGGFSLDEFTRK